MISTNNYLNLDQMKLNAQEITVYLRNAGWTDNAIAGLLGNMQTESTMNPGLWQSRNEGNLNGGYGLTQWTPASKYIDWANARGLAIGDYVSQLKRIEYEVAENIQWIKQGMTFYQFTQSTQSAYDLAVLFLNHYERPANPNEAKRGNQGTFWFDYIDGQGSGGPPTNLQDMVNWFVTRIGGPRYSMNTTLRKGPNYYDCSSAVFNALIAGDFLPVGTYPGNTGTLKTLLPTMATQVDCDNAQYGDIFLSKPPAPYIGHTGVYISNTEIIHMNWTDNGIAITPAQGRRGREPITCWRLAGIGSGGDWGDDVPGDIHFNRRHLIRSRQIIHRRRTR